MGFEEGRAQPGQDLNWDTFYRSLCNMHNHDFRQQPEANLGPDGLYIHHAVMQQLLVFTANKAPYFHDDLLHEELNPFLRCAKMHNESRRSHHCSRREGSLLLWASKLRRAAVATSYRRSTHDRDVYAYTGEWLPAVGISAGDAPSYTRRVHVGGHVLCMSCIGVGCRGAPTMCRSCAPAVPGGGT